MRWRLKRGIKVTPGQWCLNTLSNIVGTVVGIVLTFGVTFLIEYKNKQEDNKKATLIVLENIALINKECKLSNERIHESVPILEEILELTPQRVANMPEDSVVYYLSGFPQDLYIYQDFARNILNSNFDILRSTDNYKFLFQVHHFYSLYDRLQEIYKKSGPNKLLEDVNDVLNETAIKTNTLDNSLRWNLLQVVSSDRIKFYIRSYLDTFIPELDTYMPIINEALKHVVDNCGYEADDFDDFIY